MNFSTRPPQTIMRIIGIIEKAASAQSSLNIFTMTRIPRKKASTIWTVPNPVYSSIVSRSVVNQDIIEPVFVV